MLADRLSTAVRSSRWWASLATFSVQVLNPRPQFTRRRRGTTSSANSGLTLGVCEYRQCGGILAAPNQNPGCGTAGFRCHQPRSLSAAFSDAIPVHRATRPAGLLGANDNEGAADEDVVRPVDAGPRHQPWPRGARRRRPRGRSAAGGPGELIRRAGRPRSGSCRQTCWVRKSHRATRLSLHQTQGSSVDVRERPLVFKIDLESNGCVNP
jgi:hypothetical protein